MVAKILTGASASAAQTLSTWFIAPTTGIRSFREAHDDRVDRDSVRAQADSSTALGDLPGGYTDGAVLRGSDAIVTVACG